MTLFSFSSSRPRANFAPESLENDEEKLAWLRLIRSENIGPVTFYRLLETYGSAQRALEELPALSKRGGRLKTLHLADRNACLKEMDALERMGGQMIFAADKKYPLPLGATEDPPPVLSIFGDPSLLNRASIGIVGARNASLNGKKFAEKLARDLGNEGQIIVSGLARGIDTAAHSGALLSGTVAVVAGGVDIVYPQENKGLYEQIRAQGCIVAESPLGMEPLSRHFPRRNRIISGLSSGVVVVEATLKSGSLITARTAAEQGRDVFAVPGHPFDPRAEGPNRLIQDGAVLVQKAEDVLRTTQDFSGRAQTLEEPSQRDWFLSPPDVPVEGDERSRSLVLQNLSSTAVTVDELLRTCQLTIPVLQIILLELEVAGQIQRLPGNRIIFIN